MENTIDNIPFPQKDELCNDLDFISTSNKTPAASTSATIAHKDREKTGVPGEPWLDLYSLDLRPFLLNDLLTPDLDRLSPFLWLVSTQRSDHISSLHQQIMKGRKITVVENPELHLTWIYDHVYIKPMPRFLLSWAFWDFYFCSNSSPLSKQERADAKAAATGFMRSYSYMILHASDYRIAIESNLIQSEIPYSRLRQFLANFQNAPVTVSKRYQFGELRLSRLNFWVRIFLRRFMFQKVQIHYTYNAYFSRFYGPLIFIFAFFSTTLSAMQVGLASNSSPSLPPDFEVFVTVCWWYSVGTVIVAAVLFVGIMTLLVYMMLREFIYALRMLVKKKLDRRRRRWGGDQE